MGLALQANVWVFYATFGSPLSKIKPLTMSARNYSVHKMQ